MEFLVVDGVLLFTSYDEASGYELWRSDGSEAGTLLLQDFIPGPGFGFPASPTSFGDRVFFSAQDEAHGREPWVGHAAILAGRADLAIADLRGEVEALGLPSGIERGLSESLDLASRSLALGDIRLALRGLDTFAREVSALAPKVIPAPASAELLEFQGEIVDLIRGS
jgi:ELWxxDGT repeat protein